MGQLTKASCLHPAQAKSISVFKHFSFTIILMNQGYSGIFQFNAFAQWFSGNFYLWKRKGAYQFTLSEVTKA